MKLNDAESTAVRLDPTLDVSQTTETFTAPAFTVTRSALAGTVIFAVLATFTTVWRWAQGQEKNIGGVQKIVRGSVFGSRAFERDCDMLISMNYVYDLTGEPLPNIREYSIIATRISMEITFQTAFFGQRAFIGNLAEEPDEVDIQDYVERYHNL